MFSKSKLAYAKINLFLRITGVKADGYHLLYTVMQTVSLADTVMLQLSKRPEGSGPAVSLIMDGTPVRNLESNTASRSALLYLSRIGNPDVSASIELIKRIPVMAGLGGGSSDAAAVLTLMNEAFQGALTEDELRSLAGKIGADVPFFMSGGAALCEGTGEIITPVESLSGLFLLILKPAEGISTPEAYRRYDLSGAQFSTVPQEGDGITAFIHSGKGLPAYDRLRTVVPFLSNDLAEPAEQIVPGIRNIRQFLFENGAFYAGISGSGSSVFGIFDSREARDAASIAASDFEKDGCFLCSCETVDI